MLLYVLNTSPLPDRLWSRILCFVPFELAVDGNTLGFSTFPAHIGAGPPIWTFPRTVFINEVSVFIVGVYLSVSAGTQIDAGTTVIGAVLALLCSPFHLTNQSSIFSPLFAILSPNSSPATKRED